MRSAITHSRKSIFSRALIVFFAFALLFAGGIACESDDDGPGDNGGNGGDGIFRGRLKDFQTKTLIAGGVCYLLYNVYHAEPDLRGTRVPNDAMPEGFTNPLISGPNGEIELPLDPAAMGDDRWGYECTHGTAYKETLQFNIRHYYSHLRDLWVISNGMYAMAPVLAGINLDQDLGVVAGRLVWYTKDDQGRDDEEQYVGCAELSMEPVGAEIRYMGNNDMPVPNTGDGSRTETNPVNGLYIGANMPVGQVTMTATIRDGGQTRIVGQEQIFSKGNAVVISNIHVGEALGDFTEASFPDNPTPGDCR